MGLSFDLSNIIAGILFGAIGFVAFVYAKKRSMTKLMIIGGLLTVYPYFIANTWLIWGIGLVLTASIWIFKD